MQYPKEKSIIAIISLVILLSVPLADAQMVGIDYGYSTGIASLTTEDIGVRITAYNQVPHFHWWNATSQVTDYHLMFLKIFESNDVNDDGVFEIGTDQLVGAPYILPSTNWEFSGFKTYEENSVVESVQFNFTTSTTFSLPITTTPPITIPVTTPTNLLAQNEDEIQIRVHMNVSIPHQVKFDIFISRWYWTLEDSLLVFQLIITKSPHDQSAENRTPTNFSQDGNRFTFDAAYIDYAEYAIAGNTSIPVTGTFGNGLEGEQGKSIYLSFRNFGNESLTYDPILGINGSTPTSTGTSTIPNTDIEYEELLLVFGGASIIVLVIILSKLKK